jgi:hypothetical protein
MTSSARIDPGPPGGGRSSSMWSWLLPVLTFLLGCLLGAVVIAAGASSGAEDLTETPAAAPTPDVAGNEDGEDVDGETEPESEDVEVRVPESCLAAADGAVVAANRIDDVVEAVRDFDAQRLQELVDEVQEQQPQVRELAERCRSTAGERLEDAELTPAEPSASPSS